MEFRLRSEGQPRLIKVTLAPYENPLSKSPFYLPEVRETATDGLFAPIIPSEWELLKSQAARTPKPIGPIEVGSEYRAGGVAVGGVQTLAPSDGHYGVSLYTPRGALVDQLIRKRQAGEAPPGDDLALAYSKTNAFCMTARPASLVAGLVLMRGSETIHPSAVSEGFPLRFWFPLDAVKSTDEFSVVVSDTMGVTVAFKVTPKRLQKLNIR